MSLLQYLVRIYVRQYDPDSGTEKAKSPLPEPSDINKAAIMTFDEVESELKKLMASIEGKKYLYNYFTSPTKRWYWYIRLLIWICWKRKYFLLKSIHR